MGEEGTWHGLLPRVRKGPSLAGPMVPGIKGGKDADLMDVSTPGPDFALVAVMGTFRNRGPARDSMLEYRGLGIKLGFKHGSHYSLCVLALLHPIFK